MHSTPDTRIAEPIHATLKLGLPYNLILKSIEAAIHFRVKDENGKFHIDDERFFVESKKGIDHVLSEICKLKNV